jgi:hypothetical protein
MLLTCLDWVDHLTWVLLGLRAAPQEDSCISAAKLVYGAPLSLPGQFLSVAEPPPTIFVQQLHSSPPCVADKSGSTQVATAPSALQSAAIVYVR